MDLRARRVAEHTPPYDLLTFATDVHEALGAVGVGDDAVLVGHSLGGTVVTAYAAAFGCHAVVNVDQPLDLAGFQTGLQQLAPMLRGDQASFEAAITMVFDSMRGPLSEAEQARIDSIRRPDQDVVLGVGIS